MTSWKRAVLPDLYIMEMSNKMNQTNVALNI